MGSTNNSISVLLFSKHKKQFQQNKISEWTNHEYLISYSKVHTQCTKNVLAYLQDAILRTSNFRFKELIEIIRLLDKYNNDEL